MTNEEYTNMLKSRTRFIEIKQLVKEDLASFVSGEKYGLTYNEPIKTNAKLVVNYLNILVRESWIANEQINQALSKIDVCKKENVWLLLYYIEAQKIIEKVDYYKVRIDVSMIEKMLEKADPALKDDYTVKYIKCETKEKYGYDIKF